MKKRIGKVVWLSVAFVSFLPLMAQKGEPCSRMEQTYQWMKDSLDLTDNQAIKIRAINDSACTSLKAIHTEATGDRTVAKEKANAIKSGVKEQYKTVLTTEQLAKLRDHRKAQEHGKGDSTITAEEKAARMTAKMKEELNLSESQTQKLQPLNLDLINKRESMRNESTDADRDEKKKEMRSYMKQYDASVKEILNDDQDKLWEAWKEARRGKHKAAPEGE